MNTFTYLQQRGFTLVETMVTIVIFSLAILGIYHFFQPSLLLSANTIHRFTAHYLAEEGIEIVRNIRDANILQGNDWLSGLSSCTQGCQLDYKTRTSLEGTIHQLASYDDTHFLYKDPDGFFSYASGEQTPFTRKVTITALPDYSGIRADVFVFWRYNESQFETHITSYLYGY